jgi:hypothetical protein
MLRGLHVRCVTAPRHAKVEVICNRRAKCRLSVEKGTLVQEPRFVNVGLVFNLALALARRHILGAHLVTVRASAKERESNNHQ